MYKVTVDGVFAGYSDTAVFVRLHENGCYIPCEETEAEGVCVKLPYEFQDDDGTRYARSRILFSRSRRAAYPALNRSRSSSTRAGRSCSTRRRPSSIFC